jgi:hypothetical protein
LQVLSELAGSRLIVFFYQLTADKITGSGFNMPFDCQAGCRLSSVALQRLERGSGVDCWQALSQGEQ